MPPRTAVPAPIPMRREDRYPLTGRFTLHSVHGLPLRTHSPRQTGMVGSYSTPPPVSYSWGMTPVRTKRTGGPQSPSSGSPVRDQAMTPTWVCASRAANARAEPADGQAFGPNGHAMARRLPDQAVPQGRAGCAHPRHRAPLEGARPVGGSDRRPHRQPRHQDSRGRRRPRAPHRQGVPDAGAPEPAQGHDDTKEMFLNNLYGGMDEPEIKIIDVFICKLRKKLASASDGKDYIETVWGRGYVLREPSDDEARITA